jgi:aminoglycoside 3-N-acetyltransferase
VLKLRQTYFSVRLRLHPLMKALHGTFTTPDLRDHLEERVGHDFEILMVHSSLNYLQPYYKGNPLELLDMLVDYVDTKGTLAMPAFHFGDPRVNDVVASYRRQPRFDARRTPSQMGMLTELFRRRPGVKVSVHPTHRVAALGPLAEEVTAGHLRAGSTFGEGSPFDVMARRETAIIGIGCTSEVLTQVHHVEDLLGEAFPAPHAIVPVPVAVKDTEGEEHPFELRWRAFAQPRHMPRLRALMSGERLREWRFHNVPLFGTRAAWVSDDLLAAARQKLTLYGNGHA